MLKKIDRVDLAVNAIKAVKTVEVIAIGMAFTPINVVIGAATSAIEMQRITGTWVKDIWTKTEAN